MNRPDQVAAKPEAPNVLFILADDLGWNDLGVYGGEADLIVTPNLDLLAMQGMRFTDAHTAAALCAPSRYATMTGSNPHRNGRPGGSWNINTSDAFTAGITPDLTVGDVMQAAGYVTGFFGKMHLGGTAYSTLGNAIRAEHEIQLFDVTRRVDDTLDSHGFDYFYGLTSGIQHSPFLFLENGWFAPFDPNKPADMSTTRQWVDGQYPTINGVNEIVEHPETKPGFGDVDYDSSQVGIMLSDRALQFIDAAVSRGKPFLAYYASEAIHVPHTPPKDFDGDPSTIDIPVEGVTASRSLDMIHALDLQVGKLLEGLNEAGVADNTVIIFTSDNGGLRGSSTDWEPTNHDSTGVLRDFKSSIYEGGHRVPFIAKWGDGTPEGSRIAPGSVSDQVISTADWVATMYDLTGQAMQERQAMDSQSLMPILLGQHPESQPFRDFILYQAGKINTTAVRRGSMVLVLGEGAIPTELYDLATDLEQVNNLIHDPAMAPLVEELRLLHLKYYDRDTATQEPRSTPTHAP